MLPNQYDVNSSLVPRNILEYTGINARATTSKIILSLIVSHISGMLVLLIVQ